MILTTKLHELLIGWSVTGIRKRYKVRARSVDLMRSEGNGSLSLDTVKTLFRRIEII